VEWRRGIGDLFQPVVVNSGLHLCVGSGPFHDFWWQGMMAHD